MRGVIVVIILIVVVVGVFLVFSNIGQAPQQPSEDTSNQPAIDNNLTKQNIMELTSTAFSHGQDIPQKYSCDGSDISPPLAFSNVPEAAQSLALIMHDPDAPGGAFTHWLVWNIDPQVGEFSENAVPPGAVEGKNSFGKLGYGGPCPPGEEHRYFFKLYALDTMLELGSGAGKGELLSAMQGHILDTAELMGKFAR